MNTNVLVLIMVNEVGEEIECKRYDGTIATELETADPTGLAVEMWKEAIINTYWENYPEAQRFYFEDRRNWANMNIWDL